MPPGAIARWFCVPRPRLGVAVIAWIRRFSSHSKPPGSRSEWTLHSPSSPRYHFWSAGFPNHSIPEADRIGSGGLHGHAKPWPWHTGQWVLGNGTRRYHFRLADSPNHSMPEADRIGSGGTHTATPSRGPGTYVNRSVAMAPGVTPSLTLRVIGTVGHFLSFRGRSAERAP